MLFSRNAGKPDGYVVCSRIFCSFVIDAIRVRSFHPNIHSKNHSVVANSIGYCFRTSDVIFSDFRSTPTVIVICLDMLVGRSNRRSRTVDARPAFNCRSIISLAFNYIGGIDAFQDLCSRAITIRIGILNRQSDTQRFRNCVCRSVAVNRNLNRFFRRIR